MLTRNAVTVLNVLREYGAKEDLCQGNEVSRHLWYCTFSLTLSHFGASIATSPTIPVVVCGIEWEMFADRVEFPRFYMVD